MNKVIKWICIVCGAFFVLGLAAIGIGSSLGGKLFGYAFDIGSKKLYTSENMVENTVDIEAFDELNVDADMSNVFVKLGKDNKVSYKLPEELTPEITQEGKKLTITSKKKKTFDFMMGFTQAQYIIIEVNEKGLKNLNINLASGDISIEELDIDGRLKTSSGDIYITGCEAGKDVDVKASSGSIEVIDSNFESFNHKQSSGNTKIENMEAKKVTMSQSSGSSKVDSLKADTLEAKVNSGSYKISNSKVNDANISSTSGDIDADKLSCDKLYLHATSGDIDLGIVGAEDEFNYSVKATSGSVKVGTTSIKKKYEKDNGSDKSITVDVTAGDVNIGFVAAD